MKKEKMFKINLHLTYDCNLNCVHCSATRLRSKNGKFVGIEQENMAYFVNLLNAGFRYPFIVHFSPNSGESTIHPKFVDIWNEVSSVSTVKVVGLTTNGVLLYKYLPKMDLRKLKNIIFSLDGDKEAHEKIRGNGTFKKTYRSIKEVSALKEGDNSFYLQVNFVINSINMSSLRELPSLLAELNNNIIINIIPLETSFGKAKVNKERLNITLKDIIVAVNEAYNSLKKINNERVKKGMPIMKIRLSPTTAKQVIQIVSKVRNLNFSDFSFFQKGWSCPTYYNNHIYITPYGNAVPCEFFVHPLVLSHFYSTVGYVPIPHIRDFKSIDEVLNSQFFQRSKRWIDILYSSITCNLCSIKKSCPICPIYSYTWGVPDECLED